MNLTNLTMETAAILAADFSSIKNISVSLAVIANTFESRLKGQTESGFFGEMTLGSLSDCLYLHSVTLSVLSGKLGQIADKNTEGAQ